MEKLSLFDKWKNAEVKEKIGMLRHIFYLKNLNAGQKLGMFNQLKQIEDSESVLTAINRALEQLAVKNSRNEVLVELDSQQSAVRSRQRKINRKFSSYEEMYVFGTPEQKIEVLKGINEKKIRINIKLLVRDLQRVQNPYVIATLLKAIGIIGGAEQRGLLAQYLQHKDSRIRANTIEALLLLDDAGVYPYIVPMLNDENPRVIANAAKALSDIGEQNIFMVLERMVSTEDPYFIKSAHFALSKMKPEGKVNKLLKKIEAFFKIEEKQAKSEPQVEENEVLNEENPDARDYNLKLSKMEESIEDKESLELKVREMEVPVFECFIEQDFTDLPDQIQEKYEDYQAIFQNIAGIYSDLELLEEVCENLRSAEEKVQGYSMQLEGFKGVFVQYASGLGEAVNSSCLDGSVAYDDCMEILFDHQKKIYTLQSELASLPSPQDFVMASMMDAKKSEIQGRITKLENENKAVFKEFEEIVIDQKKEQLFSSVEGAVSFVNAIQKQRNSAVTLEQDYHSALASEKKIFADFIEISGWSEIQNPQQLVQYYQQTKLQLEDYMLDKEVLQIELMDFIIEREDYHWNVSLIDEYVRYWYQLKYIMDQE